MRRSLMDLPAGMVRQDYMYKGLPEELREYAYWIADSGHCVMAIPAALLERARADGDLDMYEVPVPTRYVLERGYSLQDGHVVVVADYDDEMGLSVPEEYDEF